MHSNRNNADVVAFYKKIFESLAELGIKKTTDISKLPQSLLLYGGEEGEDYAGACFADGKDDPRRDKYNTIILKCFEEILDSIKNNLGKISAWVKSQQGYHASLYVPEVPYYYNRIITSASLTMTVPVYLTQHWNKIFNKETANPYVFVDSDIYISRNFWMILFLLKEWLLSGRAILLPAEIIDEDYGHLDYTADNEPYIKETFAHKYFSPFPGMQPAIINLRERVSLSIDIDKLVAFPIPSVLGIDLKTLKRIQDKHYMSLLRFQLSIREIVNLKYNVNDLRSIDKILIEKAEYEFVKLNELYHEEARKMRWKGLDCATGLILLGLTIVLPDVYSKLIAGIFGVKSIGDGLRFLFQHSKIADNLKGTSDFWLPWYLHHEYGK